MYIAYDENKKSFNSIDEVIAKNKRYFCPICNSEVIYKKGVKIQSHFAHIKNSACSITSYKRESKEHLDVKKSLYNHFKQKYINVLLEYIFKVNNNIQIADIYIKDKNIALEYQRSIISHKMLNQRTLGYKNANIKLIWLIDINKFIKILSLRDNIYHIRYAPFVENFFNYQEGHIFFYGYDREKEAILFYEIYSCNLKKHHALALITRYHLKDFDFPLTFTLSKKKLVAKIYKSDIENYVYVQLKFDKTVKNKLLSLFYQSRIKLNNIPNLIGKNINEQLLISTPLLMWQTKIYVMLQNNKTYQEILDYMLNYIKVIDSIYISEKDKVKIIEKVVRAYYMRLSQP